MLQLYYDPGCPFCQVVLRFLREQAMDFEAKEISLWADSPTKQELVALGGKSQVPFLVDPQHQVKMYESQDILDYLKKRGS
jgi:glutathione S-transferase